MWQQSLYRTCLTGLGIALGSLAWKAEAGTTITSTTNTFNPATTEGATAGYWTVDSPLTGQILFRASELSAPLSIGDQLTGMRLRLSDDGTYTHEGPTPELIYSVFDVSIGRAASANLSYTFADNYASAPTIARTGGLTFAAGAFQENPSGVDPFGETIAFTNYHTYTGGDLLLEVRWDLTSGINWNNDVTWEGEGQTTGQSIFGSGVDATQANASTYKTNWIVEFDIAIPEPTSMIVCIFGALPFIIRRIPT